MASGTFDDWGGTYGGAIDQILIGFMRSSDTMKGYPIGKKTYICAFKSQVVWYLERNLCLVLHFRFLQKLSSKVVSEENTFVMTENVLDSLILPTFTKTKQLGSTWEKLRQVDKLSTCHVQVGDVLFALKQLWDGGSRCTLRRLAYSIRRLGRLRFPSHCATHSEFFNHKSCLKKGWECHFFCKTLGGTVVGC